MRFRVRWHKQREVCAGWPRLGARLRYGVGQGQLPAPPPGRNGTQPGKRALVTALRLGEDAAAAVHRTPQHRGVGDVTREIRAQKNITNRKQW